MPLANNVYSTRWKQVGRFQASISACWKQEQNPCTNKHNEKVAGILCVAVRAADAAHSSPQELTKKMKQFVPFQPTSRGTKFQVVLLRAAWVAPPTSRFLDRKCVLAAHSC